MENISSEQELLELRKDGKISEDEYNQLLNAMRKSVPTESESKRGWLRKNLALCMVLMVIVISAGLFSVLFLSEKKPVLLEEFRRGFPEKVAKLNIDNAKLSDVIKTFGEPEKYIWGREVIDKKKIPVDRYCIQYPDGFQIFMLRDSIVELRFENPEADYSFDNKLRVGDSLDDVFNVVGQPMETVVGEKIDWKKDRVLYKDIEGKKGHCYYHCPDKNVRFWLVNYKIKAIYVTRSDYNQG